MKSIIVIGSEDSRNNYIADYIKNNRIKSYNIIRFVDRVKIADVRDIKKIISVKQPSSEKRIFILSSDITSEAQNALLKTLEELPENCGFIFSLKNPGSLLPTIVSRSFIVKLDNKESNEDSNEYEKMLIELICNTKNNTSFATSSVSPRMVTRRGSSEVESDSVIPPSEEYFVHLGGVSVLGTKLVDKKNMLAGFLLLSSKIAASTGVEELEKLILALRKIMLILTVGHPEPIRSEPHGRRLVSGSIGSNRMPKLIRHDVKEIGFNSSDLILSLLSQLTRVYPLVCNNNFNKKLTLDYVFISSLFSKEA